MNDDLYTPQMEHVANAYIRKLKEEDKVDVISPSHAHTMELLKNRFAQINKEIEYMAKYEPYNTERRKRLLIIRQNLLFTLNRNR